MTVEQLRDWFRSDAAREFMENCFHMWEDDGPAALTSAERERYDGWIGEFILESLAEGVDDIEEWRDQSSSHRSNSAPSPGVSTPSEQKQ